MFDSISLPGTLKSRRKVLKLVKNPNLSLNYDEILAELRSGLRSYQTNLRCEINQLTETCSLTDYRRNQNLFLTLDKKLKLCQWRVKILDLQILKIDSILDRLLASKYYSSSTFSDNNNKKCSSSSAAATKNSHHDESLHNNKKFSSSSIESVMTVTNQQQHNSTLSRKFLQSLKNTVDKISWDMNSYDYSNTSGARKRKFEPDNNSEKCGLTIKDEIAALFGVFKVEVKELVGFARLTSGSAFEVVLKCGYQKFKTKCKVNGLNREQRWDQFVFYFRYLYGELLYITVIESHSFTKSSLVEDVSFDFLNFLNPSLHYDKTIDLSRTGSLKLNFLVEWKPLEDIENFDRAYLNSMDSTKTLKNSRFNPIDRSSVLPSLKCHSAASKDHETLIFAATKAYQHLRHQLQRYINCPYTQVAEMNQILNRLSDKYCTVQISQDNSDVDTALQSFNFLEINCNSNNNIMSPVPSSENTSSIFSTVQDYNNGGNNFIFDTHDHALNLCFCQHFHRSSDVLQDLFTSVNGLSYKKQRLNELDDEILSLNEIDTLKFPCSLKEIHSALTKLKVERDTISFWLSACGNQGEMCSGLYLTHKEIRQELERVYGYLLSTNYPASPTEIFDDIINELSRNSTIYPIQSSGREIPSICTVFQFGLYFKSNTITHACDRLAKERYLLQRLQSEDCSDIQAAFDFMEPKNNIVLTDRLLQCIGVLLCHENLNIRNLAEIYLRSKEGAERFQLIDGFASALNSDNWIHRLGSCKALKLLNAQKRLNALISVYSQDSNELVRKEAEKVVQVFRWQINEAQRKYFTYHVRSSNDFSSV